MHIYDFGFNTFIKNWDSFTEDILNSLSVSSKQGTVDEWHKKKYPFKESLSVSRMTRVQKVLFSNQINSFLKHMPIYFLFNLLKLK